MRIFNTSGRSRRTEYLFDQLIFTLSFFLLLTILFTLSENLDSHVFGIFAVFFNLIIFSLFIVVDVISSIKRLHDLNRRGEHIFYLLIPFYNFAFWLRLLFEKGTVGDNRYGPDPRTDSNSDYNKKLISNIAEVVLLIALIWVVVEIEQNRNLKEVQAFIQNPTEDRYLILESDEDTEYSYFIVKITEIIPDSCVVYCSNHSYSTTYDAVESVPSILDDFDAEFSYWGTFSLDFLEEVKIVEVVN
jgi:uncharacterized membrane protein YhaH (DUF805 family)